MDIVNKLGELQWSNNDFGSDSIDKMQVLLDILKELLSDVTLKVEGLYMGGGEVDAYTKAEMRVILQDYVKLSHYTTLIRDLVNARISELKSTEEVIGKNSPTVLDLYQHLTEVYKICFGTDLNGVVDPNIVPYFSRIGELGTLKTSAKDSLVSAINELFDRPSGGGGGAEGDSIWVQPEEPIEAVVDDVWVDTDDYSRYDVSQVYRNNTILQENDDEVLMVDGSITVILHQATNPGIIKKIYNKGTGIVTVSGLINGVRGMKLYPKESVELVTDGDGWRY